MLPKENRLTEKADFEFVKQNGKFISAPIFSISFVKQAEKTDGIRFGFIVSKKISTKAHIRNRVKRILREILRTNISLIPRGYDYVIVAKPGIVHANRVTIQSELEKCLKNISERASH